jgi:hypothetical protein
MKPIRQGDVILVSSSESITAEPLPHLTVAEGEVTGHRHRISNGNAELYEQNGTLYLRILSPIATLVHEEHNAISVPQGLWMIRIQREYRPEGWNYVKD